ncbi:MAG TPA: ester cyclase [Terriglobales bacterium]|nr:ester cyclase [Terriglobales bacterium]
MREHRYRRCELRSRVHRPPPGPRAPNNTWGALKRFPDMRVSVEDIVAENDKVVVRNTWTGTDTQTGKKIRFSGIVIWRIAHRQLVERWACLEAPKPA